jgi:hypothetical protein
MRIATLRKCRRHCPPRAVFSGPSNAVNLRIPPPEGFHHKMIRLCEEVIRTLQEMIRAVRNDAR